jgi:hypothetical protein
MNQDSNPNHFVELQDITLRVWSVRDGIQWQAWTLPTSDPEHPVNQIVSMGKDPRDYYDEVTLGNYYGKARD